MNTVIDCDILSYSEAVELEENITALKTLWAVHGYLNQLIWHDLHNDATYGYAIRPCLRMDECTFKVGDTVDWFGLRWRYIGKNIWLCDYAISYMTFRTVFRDYSVLHTWLNDWYESKLNEKREV